MSLLNSSSLWPFGLCIAPLYLSPAALHSVSTKALAPFAPGFRPSKQSTTTALRGFASTVRLFHAPHAPTHCNTFMHVMDKRWMDIGDRRQPAYINGVNSFLDFAFNHSSRGNIIRCPCYKCGNNHFHTREIVFVHLILNGIVKTYKWWSSHGEDHYVNPNIERDDDALKEVEEDISEHDNIHDLLHDFNFNDKSHNGEEHYQEDPNEAAKSFYDLLNDAEQELYPGCKEFSKFQFMVTLLALKSDYGWTDRSFTALLKVLKRAIPFSEKLPSSFYEANNYIQELGLECKKIDACLNDCILYRGKFANFQSCPTCGTSRWKLSKINNNAEWNTSSGKSKNIPNKVLRHFPLIPRLQRLYMCSKTAEDMQWHKERHRDDGNLRHPADAFAWKSFDEKHSEFSSDARNIRLGLASDGFNPFGIISTNYSVWPVVLIPYNMPPWLCMKTPNFFISLIIPGPGQPGNDIDVYLQPLIDELKILWEFGVHTYDAYTKCNFNMRAAVLWTINDFPAYANLSGWSTKGKLACPCCNKDTWYCRLKNGSKMCYMGSRCFLEPNHRWRKDKKSFDGTIEIRPAPKVLSGDEILEQLKECDDVIFGKLQKKKKAG
ncbi:hypothetical protein KSP39_PZI005941 [Platanthera zijinensis]|uniref:Transposase-associated domain-containing protein n=1 Tax=Platanthera zijinensis TaxID=2320716 RepID=A0AAP0BTZ5_9ASPA